jgi:hypothetical protein
LQNCSKNEKGEFSTPFFVPDSIHIYKDASKVDWNVLVQYLRDMLGSNIIIDLRDDFFSYHLDAAQLDSIAEQMVRTKVFDVSDPTKAYDPFPVEIAHEKDMIIGAKKRIFGMLYDGFKMQRLLRGVLPGSESTFKHLHLVFTDRSIGTWDRGDGRYHARTCVYGFPSIISTTGLVEAPAKPREFYIIRKGLVGSGMSRELVEEELKSKFEGRFIDYDDERSTEIVKGYLMQAFFYHTTFEPFCDDKSCRLFNAHWQEDMIHAQLEGKDLCERHEGILSKIKK